MMGKEERRDTADGRRTQFPRVALTLLLVLGTGAVASGVATGAGRDPRDSPPPSGLSPLDPGQPAAEELAKAAREAGLRGERQREERQFPAAKAEREASRRAYHGLGRERALALAAERFEGNATAAGLYPFAGADDVQLLNRFTARVVRDGHASVIVSDGPLAADEGDELVPLDLRLERRGENFVPSAAPAPVALPSRLADGVRAPDGVMIEHQGAADAVGEQVGGAVVYPSARADVDVVVRPTVEGVELYDVLRSEESPEELAISVNARGGASLRAADNRDDGFEVVTGGKVLGRLGLPFAIDADGIPVDVDTMLDGSTLRMEVRHRGRDLRYPILVDPPYAVSESWNWGCPNSVCPPDSNWNGRAGWYFEANAPTTRFWSGVKPANAWLGGGLGIEHSSGGTWFADGEYAYWRYRSVGQTRIVRASLTSSLAAATGSSLCLFRGISGWSKEGNFVWEVNEGPNTMCGDGRPDVCCGDEYLDVVSPTWSVKGRLWNNLLSGIYFRFGQNRSFFVHRTKQAFVELWDDDDPAVTANIPSDWTRQTTFTADATDAGTGVREIGFYGQASTSTCSGTRQNLCPQNRSVTSGAYPEGIYSVDTYAIDGSGRWNRHGKGLRASYYDEDLFTGYRVDKTEGIVDMNWGDRSPDPALHEEYFSSRWTGRIRPPVSGTYSFYLQSDDHSQMWLDGQPAASANCCTEGQPWTVTLTANRFYDLRIDHREQVGNAYLRLYWSGPNIAKALVPRYVLYPPAANPDPTYEVKVDTSSPSPITPSGELWDRRAEIIDRSLTGSVKAEDGNPLGAATSRRSGVQRIEAWLTYPTGLRLFQSKAEQGKTCTVKNAQGQDVQSPDSCPLTHSYTFDGGNPIYPAGQYKIEFLAYDHAGNAAGEKSWTFTKGDLTNPILLRLTHSPTLPSGWVDNHNGRVTGSATDIGTGLHRLELTEPLNGGDQTRPKRYKSPGTQTECDGSLTRPCPAAGDEYFDYSTSTYREGYVEASVVAVDVSGRRSNRIGYTLKVDHNGPTLDTPSGSLWDRRNREDDHRFEGLYGQQHTAHLRATDGSNASNSTRRSGTKAINVKVRRPDGSVIVDSPDPAPQGCPAESCSKTRDFTLDGDAIPDGDYTIEVIAVDQLNHPSEVTRWDVTVDRRGDVFHATRYTANPADGGQQIADEWHRHRTALERMVSPHQIATRGLVPCDDAAPQGPQCLERRERSRDSEYDSNARDTYVRYRGTSDSDARVDYVGSMAPEAGRRREEAAVVGPLFDVVEPWQTPPPGHGTEYERHDRVTTTTYRERTGGDNGEQPNSEENGPTVVERTEELRDELFLDSDTKLPLKRVVRNTSTNAVSGVEYYAYERRRKEMAELPAGWFTVPPPPNPDQEKSVEHQGSATSGQRLDAETQRTYQPYSYGNTPTLLGQRFCLSSRIRIRHFETNGTTALDLNDIPSNLPGTIDITTSEAHYAPIAGSASCAAGQLPLGTPQLSVRTARRDSTMAQIRRKSFEAFAEDVELETDNVALQVGLMPILTPQPQTALLMSFGDVNAALLDYGETQVELIGPITKPTLQQFVNALQAG